MEEHVRAQRRASRASHERDVRARRREIELLEAAELESDGRKRAAFEAEAHQLRKARETSRATGLVEGALHWLQRDEAYLLACVVRIQTRFRARVARRRVDEARDSRALARKLRAERRQMDHDEEKAEAARRAEAHKRRVETARKFYSQQEHKRSHKKLLRAHALRGPTDLERERLREQALVRGEADELLEKFHAMLAPSAIRGAERDKLRKRPDAFAPREVERTVVAHDGTTRRVSAPQLAEMAKKARGAYRRAEHIVHQDWVVRHACNVDGQYGAVTPRLSRNTGKLAGVYARSQAKLASAGRPPRTM